MNNTHTVYEKQFTYWEVQLDQNRPAKKLRNPGNRSTYRNSGELSANDVKIEETALSVKNFFFCGPEPDCPIRLHSTVAEHKLLKKISIM